MAQPFAPSPPLPYDDDDDEDSEEELWTSHVRSNFARTSLPSPSSNHSPKRKKKEQVEAGSVEESSISTLSSSHPTTNTSASTEPEPEREEGLDPSKAVVTKKKKKKKKKKASLSPVTILEDEESQEKPPADAAVFAGDLAVKHSQEETRKDGGLISRKRLVFGFLLVVGLLILVTVIVVTSGKSGGTGPEIAPSEGNVPSDSTTIAPPSAAPKTMPSLAPFQQKPTLPQDASTPPFPLPPDATPKSTSRPTFPAPSTQMPSMVPTMSRRPSLSPTTRSPVLGIAADGARIQQVVLNISGSEAFEQEDSPQSQALAWLLSITSSYDPQLIPRYVLAVFFYAMGGPRAWGSSYAFRNEESVCEWHGIGCNSEGNQVTSWSDDSDGNGPLGWNGVLPGREMAALAPSLKRLTLDDESGIQGPLPTELGLLGELERLDFTSNSLTGTIPTEWGNLVRLERLHLSHNPLRGTIPTELGKLTNLNRFLLEQGFGGSTGGDSLIFPRPAQEQQSNNTFDESLFLSGPIPTELGLMTKLANLRLQSPLLNSTIPTSLGQLENLRELRILSQELVGTIPTELGALNLIKSVVISSPGLTGTVPEELCLLRRKSSGPQILRLEVNCGVRPNRVLCPDFCCTDCGEA